MLSPGFLFYSAPRVNKRGGGICLFYRYDIHLENFEKFTSAFFECCYASLTVGATSYLVIAVYRPPGLNFISFIDHVGATSYLVIAVYRPPGLHFKSFVDHFTVLFEEKRQQLDKIVLLGDFNISLNVNNHASKMWNSFFEDFGLTQYVSEKTHRSGGILDHVIASNNILINVKSNSFITSSDHSFICFSSYKQRKS